MPLSLADPRDNPTTPVTGGSKGQSDHTPLTGGSMGQSDHTPLTGGSQGQSDHAPQKIPNRFPERLEDMQTANTVLTSIYFVSGRSPKNRQNTNTKETETKKIKHKKSAEL